jgi:hypothetical protein
MDVRVNTTSRQYEFFSRDDIRGSTNNHARVDSFHYIWISSLANTYNSVSLDTDIRLENTRHGIDYESIGNHNIECLVREYSRSLAK